MSRSRLTTGSRRVTAETGEQARGGRGRPISLLPSVITVLALCLGMSAVKFGLDGQLEAAYFLVAGAAVLDAVDGRIARLLDVSSAIGAELDSLADAVSFGVAPALLLYITLLDGNRGGWVVALVFVVCVVLRLARFNTLLDTDPHPDGKEFFTGVPSPSGAMVALLPLAVTQQQGAGWWSNPVLVSVWVLATAGLVISRIPTLSVSAIRVPSRFAAPALVGVAAVIAGLVVYPLVLVVALTVAYLAHLPLAARMQQRSRASSRSWSGRHPRLGRRRPSARRLGLRPPRVRGLAGRKRP